MSNKSKLPNNYFPHDFNARFDRKILRCRKVLGIEGYGIYWMLIETLCLQENFSYPLKDVDLLADDFGCSVEKVEAVIKQFELFQIDTEAKFFSMSLIARMQKYLELSEKARQSVNLRWDKARKLKELQINDSTVIPPYYDSNTIKEKNIKEKEIIENNIKEIDSIVPVWNTFAKFLNLTQIMKLTPKRIASLKQRIKEPEFNLESIMQKIKMSDFLQGKNKQGWKVDFDFVFCSKNNYIKILEGKYDGTNNGNGGATIGGLTAIVNRRLEREQKGD